ncbi:GDSL-type esterase/lipase family protein [Jiangella gansuensis]|uniref:GDSL-type esterase/lipase family protein n=1 Tax=Jiangella gansuensis TaxID=281473 RepID=UPI000687CA2B
MQLNDTTGRPAETIDLRDDRVTWGGTIEVEHGPGWSRGWRLPLSRIELFPGDGLRSRAAMQAGVRLEFSTDATVISGSATVMDEADATIVDLVVKGTYLASAPVLGDGSFTFTGLAPVMKEVELWLPQYGDVRLTSLAVNAGADVRRSPDTDRPRLVTYGSSITQCRAAASPSRTWPALVAADLGMDLTCLGFGSECHVDPMIARLIRDRPADLVVTCLGINVYGSGTFTERSFLPAVLGFLSTVRDGHPGTPIVVISPIVSPDREAVAGPTGMTLAELRSYVEEAVALLAEHDDGLHLIRGLEAFGPDQAHLLHDGLHPGPDGYVQLARSILGRLRVVLDGG